MMRAVLRIRSNLFATPSVSNAAVRTIPIYAPCMPTRCIAINSLRQQRYFSTTQPVEPQQPQQQHQQQGQQQQQEQQQQQQDNSKGANQHSMPWSTKIGIAFFLSTAAFAVYLGTWQVRRRVWKQELIERRTAALSSPPIDLLTYLRTRPASAFIQNAASTPASSSSSSTTTSPSSSSTPTEGLDDECRRVFSRGRFLYDKTMRVGPRSPPSTDASSTAGQGIGYYLITPFQVENSDLVVLVNRGWCSKEKCTGAAELDHESQNEKQVVEIVGIIRKGEAHPQFLSGHDPIATGSFIFLDLPFMTKLADIRPSKSVPQTAEPNANAILLDAFEIESNRNRNMKRRSVADYLLFSTTPMIHAVYATTWFTLAAALTGLTYVRFKKRMPVRQLAKRK